MFDGTYIPWVSFHVSPISISPASLASMILPARAMVDRSQMEVGLAKRDKPFIRFPPSLKNINAWKCIREQIRNPLFSTCLPSQVEAFYRIKKKIYTFQLRCFLVIHVSVILPTSYVQITQSSDITGSICSTPVLREKQSYSCYKYHKPVKKENRKQKKSWIMESKEEICRE